MEPLFSTDEKAYKELIEEIKSYISLCGVVHKAPYYGNILIKPTTKELVGIYNVDEATVVKALADIGFNIGFRRD